MRSLIVAAAVWIAPAIGVAAPTQSNPAFLGVVMGSAPGGCLITAVTSQGAAADAGVQRNDLVIALDELPLLGRGDPCIAMSARIVAHQPGDLVRIDLERDGRPLVVTAALTTRAEVFQRHVGSHVDPTDLVDTTDLRHTYDLADHSADRTTIVGWFTTKCDGCANLFERVKDGVAKRTHAAPLVLGVIAYDPPDPYAKHDLKADYAMLRKGFASSVPLAVADTHTVDALAMLEDERVFFMVIDGHGVVRFVAPLAPNADDLDAALDDLLAAAEQAEHARR